MPARAFFLSSHVHACVSGEQLVFLDLRRDQYFSLDRRSSGPVTALLHQTHEFQSGPAQPASMALRRGNGAQHHPNVDIYPESANIARALSLLLEQELITTDPDRGRPFSAPLVPQPTESALSRSMRKAARISAVDTVRFARAATRAATMLRGQPIQRTVQRVSLRRPAHPLPFDRGLLRDSMSRYRTLRPLFPKRYACLFDSLAVIELLALYGTYPWWVFGVHACPFGAHCWVQEGNFLLTDTIDNIRRFTPIMMV